MWKRVDDVLYQKLKKGYRNDNSFVIYLLLMIIFDFFLFSISGHFIDDMFKIMIMIIIGAFVDMIAIVLCLRYVKKSYAVRERLKRNNARYTEAVLIAKGSVIDTSGTTSSDEKYYQVYVSVGNVKIKTVCDRVLFSECIRGDRVYLVDLLGEEARNPRSCVAVKEISSPELIYNESDAEKMPDGLYDYAIDRMRETGIYVTAPENNKSKAEDEIKRPMNEDEKNIVIGMERKPVIVLLIVFLLILSTAVLSFCVSRGVLLIGEEDQQRQISDVVTTILPFSRVAVLPALFVLIYFGYVHLSNIRQIRRSTPLCAELRLVDKSNATYTSGKNQITIFYYTCENRYGTRIGIESVQRSSVRIGSKVLVVYYGSKNKSEIMDLSHTKLYQLR